MPTSPKKQSHRRGVTVVPQPNLRRATSKIAWGEDPVMSSRVRFLDESDFAKQTIFNNQRSNLFSPEAKELRRELMQTLTRSLSEENLKFLIAMYNLNFQQKISPEKMQAGLEKIQKQYIDPDAPTRINIQDIAYKRIIASHNKSPLDYKDAIKEICMLIRQNLNKSELLTKLDDVTFITNTVNKLIADLHSFSKFKISGLDFMSSFFSTKTDTKLFVQCQKICKAAQDNLRELIKSHSLEDVMKAEDDAETKLPKLNSLESDYKAKLTAVLSNIQKHLIANFIEIHKLEKSRKFFIKSDEVKTTIVTISQTGMTLGLHLGPGLPVIPEKKVKEDTDIEDKNKPRWTNR